MLKKRCFFVYFLITFSCTTPNESTTNIIEPTIDNNLETIRDVQETDIIWQNELNDALFSKMIQLTNGDFVLTSHSQTYQISANGNLIWKQNVGTGGIPNFSGKILHQQNNTIVIGGINGLRPKFIRLDLGGNIITNKTYPNSYFKYTGFNISTMLPVSDNKFAYFGDARTSSNHPNTPGLGSNSGQAIYLLLDFEPTNGQDVIQYAAHASSHDKSFIADAILNNTGKFVTSGAILADSNDKARSYFIDTLNGFQSSINYNGNSAFGFGRTIKQNNDGNYVIAGIGFYPGQTSPNNSFLGSGITIIDNNSSVLKSIYLDSYNSSYYEDFILLDNGSYIFVGGQNNFSSGSYVYMAELTPDGEAIRVLKFPELMNIEAIVKTNDGYVIAGNKENNIAWIAKIKSL